MRHHISTLSLAVFAALLLCNCDSVTTTYPLTAKPKTIDKEKFEGTWLIDDDGQTAQVKFADDGIAHIAGLEWKDDHFQIEKVEMTIAEGNEHNFMSIREQKEGKWADEYALAQYMFSEHGDLVFWMPNADTFKKAIEEKSLQGTVKKGKYSTSISITSDAATLLKFLNDPENLNLFNYKQPVVIPKTASVKKD